MVVGDGVMRRCAIGGYHGGRSTVQGSESSRIDVLCALEYNLTSTIS